MPIADELAGQDTGDIQGALLAGVRDISRQVAVTFTTYVKRVLPADGFVFWLRAGETPRVTGMLHHAVERTQNEDDTTTGGQVVFTTETPIVALTGVSTSVLIVGEVEGEKYAFRAHGMYAEQANLWHYIGSSLLASLASQFVDNPAGFDATRLIVSNSLPAWLALASYNPVWLLPPNPGITLYPSYLVDDNLPPPFGAVHIEPTATQAFQSIPWLRSEPDLPAAQTRTRHWQLAADSVRVTLYGCDAVMAAAFLDLVVNYCRDTENIGLMGIPVIRDDKRTWPEGMILAMRKTIEFQVSYYQAALWQVAQKLITEAVATVIPE